MASSALPDVIDALVTMARTALPNVNVSDGFGVTDDPGDFLMIGVEDPDIEDAAFSGEVDQEWTYANTTTRTEDGSVSCAVVSWNGDCGDEGQKAARDAAYAALDAFADALRANYSLGLSTVIAAAFKAGRLSQNQSDDGSVAMVLFTVGFRARI